jgi:hypothetical protein
MAIGDCMRCGNRWQFADEPTQLDNINDELAESGTVAYKPTTRYGGVADDVEAMEERRLDS